MNNWRDYMFVGIIVCIILFGVYYFVLRPIEYEQCKVTDFLDVSAGGFLSSSVCVYNTSCGKMISDDCTKQLGEYIMREVK